MARPSSIDNNDNLLHFNTVTWSSPHPSSQQWSEATPEQPYSARGSSIGSPQSIFEIEQAPGEQRPSEVVMDERDRTVNRRLRGIHVFMITISGVLGVGLYVRSGSILRIGGPAAVLITTTIMGLLAWLVMQCIGEMLALWPISNALVEFVGTWVDEDLGTAVGVVYWLTYSINFAAMIVAAAGQIEIWTKTRDENHGKAIQGTIIFFVVPLFLVLFNSFGVQVYGLTEVIGGSLKILGAIIVIICMIVINVRGYETTSLRTKYYEGDMFVFHGEVADNWAEAFFVCLSIAAFAYIGVEIAAATALEARVDQRAQAAEKSSPGESKLSWPTVSVRFSATWTSFIAWILYFLGGLLMTLNVEWDDENLPRAGWLGSPAADEEGHLNTDSGFVISASYSKIPGLADMFTVILLITALTAANTNLYVASRTLFGLTRKLHGKRWRWLAFFGRTNNYQVPVRAMFLSCLFLWIPFLYLSPNNSPDTTIPSLLEVLSQLGSVSCIIVWACESWAFIRLYNCLKTHKDELSNSPEFAHVCRFLRTGGEDHYPWRSHGQPVTMYLALFGCLFVLIVANGSVLWHAFQSRAFLSAYLAPILFLPLWLFIKVYRSHGWKNIKWELEDLTNVVEVQDKIRRLDEIKQRATTQNDGIQPPGWGNLWGLI